MEKDFDCLSINNGASIGDSTTQIGTFCGEQPPGEITSNGNQLYLKFTSDWGLEKKGFRVFYKSKRYFQ